MQDLATVSDKAKSAVKETSTAMDKLGSDGSKAPPKITDEMKKLIQEEKNTQNETSNTGSSLDNLKQVGSNALGMLKDGAGELVEKIQNVSPEASKVVEVLGQLGVGGVVGVTAVAGAVGGMALAIKTGVNNATELDDAMAKFQARTGASTSEMNKFKNVARDVWSNNFGESIEDVADVMGTVKSQIQGINDQDLSKVSKGLLTLRDTFDMDVDETFRGMNSLITQFGLTYDEAMDLMAKGGQQGLDYTHELGDNVAEYAGKFAQAGYSAQEYFQLLENGSQGGAYNLDKVNDAINEVTNRIAGGDIEGALDKFNDKTKEVFKSWQKGGVEEKEVINQLIEDIRTTTNEEEKRQKMQVAFGTMGEDFNAGFIESLTTVGDSYKNIGGTMEDVERIANGGLKNAISEFGRTVSNIFTPLGEVITQPFSKAIAFITVGIRNIPQAFDVVKQKISDVFSKIDVSGFMDAINNLVSNVRDGLEPAFKGVKDAIDKAKEALAPIAQEIASKIGPTIQNVVDQASKIVSVVGPPIIAIIQAIIQKVQDTIPVITTILSVVGTVISGIIDFINLVITTVGTAIATIISVITPIIQVCATITSSIWSVIMTVAQNIWNKVSEVVTAIVGFFNDVWKTGSDVVNKIWSKIQDSVNKIQDKVQGVVDNINKYFNDVKSTVSNVFDGIWSKIKDVMDRVGNKISSVLDGIKGAWNGLTSFTSGVFSGIESACNSLVSSVKGFVNGVIGGINGAISIINKIPGVSIGKIPKLERGGVLRRGQIGLLEGNGAEAVVPLEKNKAWIRAVAKDMAQIMPSVTTNNNGQTINFYNKAQSPDEIARALRIQARYGYGGVVQ